MDIFERLIMAGGFFIALLLLPSLLLGLAIPYAVQRFRDADDPQGGLKIALYYFFSLSLILILTGMTIIAADMMESNLIPRGRFGGRGGMDRFPNSAHRTGFALMASGGLFALFHFLLILMMTDKPFSSPVRRLFIGWRFAIHGLMVMFAVTMLALILFERDGFDSGLYSYLGVLTVWIPSWLIHLVLLRLHSVKKPGGWAPAYSPPEETPFDRPNPPL